MKEEKTDIIQEYYFANKPDQEILRNVAKTSEMKTIFKNVLEEKKLSEAEPIYKKAVSTIDKLVSSGQL